MNVTFMIGNGFDLNLGLETSYEKFIDEYRSNNLNDSDEIRAFKERMEKDLKNWSDVELALGKCTKDFTGDKAGDAFFECYNDIYDKLADYLEREEQKVDNCSDEMIREGMKHALTNWQRGFRTARNSEIQNRINQIGGGYRYNFIIFNYTKTVDRCIKTIRNTKLLGARTVSNNSYENTISRQVHVHGYTDKDMILAVNDESQIANMDVFADRLIYDSHRLIKNKANKLFEEGTDDLAYELLKTSDLIYIYGMSLGETDKLWWQRIGEVLDTHKNTQVIYYSFKAPKDERHYMDFLKHENRIRGKLATYFEEDFYDIDNMLTRIHVVKYNVFEKLSNIALEMLPQSIKAIS